MLSPWTRALAVGAAAGSRASLGFTAPLRLTGRPALAAVHALGVVGELVGDKLPMAPSRLDRGGPVVRAVAGAVGGATVAVAARRADDALGAGHVAFAAALGAAASLAGTYGGATWRRFVAERGLPDWPAALAEDAVALGLARVGLREVG
ncbi:hypothetical protein [Luteimicrobium subarcticum]|uniref:DUF4126 domain-containing protein n=1 Tax=Luteimicrobium subarcticum TaxID=620910 RepID=A0A2M8WV58_9MICO|nr:hypothetical protein [Luteimicrobium subarcticum]PJI94808.1 hypothetical protein CLV34_0656 [Luteimicrobium subarcticum]